MTRTTDGGITASLAARKSRSASPPPLSMLPWVFGDAILFFDDLRRKTNDALGAIHCTAGVRSGGSSRTTWVW
jgi:hypothetical protein